MTLSRLIAFNTLAQYLGKGVSLVAGILLTSVLSRKLGVGGYGGYVFIYTIVLFANALADWGSTFITIREASKAGANQARVFGNTLILKVLASLLVTAGLLLLTQTLPMFAEQRPIFLIAGFLIPLLALKSFFQVIFQTRLELWKLSVIDTLSSLFFLGAILLVPGEFITLRLVFSLLLAAAIVSIVAGEIFIVREVPISLKPDKGLMRTLLRESAVMGLLLTIFSMYNRLDIILLERIQGQDAVGIYGLSYKIYENLVVGAAFFSNSVFPILASRAGKKKLFRKTFQKIIGSLLVAGVVISVGTIILAGPVVYLISGPEFARSVAPLQILGISLVVAYLNHATGYSLVALNRQIVSMVIAAGALVINLGLNLLLIPRFSYLASAGITLLTELIVFSFSILALTKITGRLSLKETLADLNPKLLLKKLRS